MVISGDERWLEETEWAVLVPDCMLSLPFISLIENATEAKESRRFGAFFANILGSKYQMYAETYRGRASLLGNRALNATSLREISKRG